MKKPKRQSKHSMEKITADDLSRSTKPVRWPLVPTMVADSAAAEDVVVLVAAAEVDLAVEVEVAAVAVTVTADHVGNLGPTDCTKGVRLRVDAFFFAS